MRNKKQQRKKVFVSREIQGRIVSKLAIYWATYHLALWHAMFLFHYFLYRGQLLADPTMSPVPFPIQYFKFLTQHYSMLLCALATFPLIFWDMMKVTHRVAGPLVRFTNTLEQMARGEKVKKIQLRDGDYLTEFQDAFNEYLEKTGQLQPGEAIGEWGVSRSEAEEPAAAENESRMLAEMRDLSESVSADGSAADAEKPEELQVASADS